MTATAGPGFTLMGEGIGLAWMAEIPIVVVDVQRGGPATGLPTKTEQSDLQTALHPAHGDSKLPVIAPGTVEECFYAAIHAFNWAERYQGPVMVLSEHMMAERSQNIPLPNLDLYPPERRQIYTGDNGYLRYDSWELSPMPIPGSPGSYVANGSEHDSYGDTTHLPDRHVQMTERRFGKLKLLEDGYYEAENMDAAIAIMPWGGSKGPGREAWDLLNANGQSIAWRYTMFLHPLPPNLLEDLLQKDLVIVPELKLLGPVLGLPADIRHTSGIHHPVHGPSLQGQRPCGAHNEARRGPRKGGCSSMSAKNPEYDFKWCPGCGDFGVRRALEFAIEERGERTGEAIYNNVIVAGIGCSGNLVHLYEGEQPYGLHGIHGRTLPLAFGVKMGRPDLNVVVVAGDGDFLSIGQEHIAPRRPATWTSPASSWTTASMG